MIYLNLRRKGDYMDAIQMNTVHKNETLIDDAMNTLFSKLDEAIDDMENGRVQTLEDAWTEIDAV